MDTIKTVSQFISVLEIALYEIYDHHATLNANTGNSQRVVPSGTDTWAEYIDGKPVITEVRKNFGTAIAGITPGMEVIAVNDIPVKQGINAFIGTSLKTADVEAKNFALRLLLAGNHIRQRKLTLRSGDIIHDYFPDVPELLLENISYPTKLDYSITNGIGYIKINNCLFNNELIGAFDSVMQKMAGTKSLILDLRETPSGGNSTVARAILGWFMNKEFFYQKHEDFSEEKEFGVKRSWEEIVTPRKAKYYSKPLVILADHWTGSMGEGITIGFDAMKRPCTTIIGTSLARLNGAGETYELPNTKIRFSFPIERLYHINGLSREQYIPDVYIDLLKEKTLPDGDIFITKAMEYLKRK